MMTHFDGSLPPALEISQLKRQLKFAPKMGRELRAEYLLTAVNAPPRTLSPTTLGKIRAELARLDQSPKPGVRRFVAQMQQRYPGVCDAIRP